MPRLLPALALAGSLALALTGCDVFYIAQARVPLVAPLKDACLQSAISRGPQRWRREKVDDDAVNGAAVAYATPSMFHSAWETVVQIAQRDSAIYPGGEQHDSSAVLALTAMQVNRRFAPADVTLVSTELVTRALKVRDACGGRSPDDELSFSVNVNDTPYRMWTLRGTHGRGALRLTVDSLRYLLMFARNSGRTILHSDTLASAKTDSPKWLEVDALQLPPTPKGATFATHCWRGDSAETGGLVAFARTTSARFQIEILSAWDTDPRTMRIREVPIDGVECLNGDGASPLTERERLLRRDAITFRPSPGRARIYAYLSYAMITPHVAVDDRIVGRLRPGVYTMIEVDSGRHKVSTPGRGEATMWIDAAADSSYFVELRKKKIGFGVTLKMMPDGGRRFVRAAEMVPAVRASSPPGKTP